jgi:hypothetical protein
MKLKTKTKIARKPSPKSANIMPLEVLAQAARIPHKSYSATTEWFADRLVLAFLTIGAVAFAAGSLFVLRWSQPLGDSQFYGVVYTKTRQAQEGIVVYSQQVIDVASPVFSLLVKENREVVEPPVDQLAIRRESLKKYLASKNSPFADDDGAIEAFAASKNMKLMVAISFVESTFGKHCYYYNCSGIGGTPPNLRKYDNYAQWIADFDQLLEDRYKDVPVEKFIGLYVQPGSPNWLYGVNQVLTEFEELGMEI